MSEEICGKPVGKGAVQFQCTVLGREHKGPCATQEVAPTIVARRKWLAEQEEQAPVKPDIVQSSTVERGNRFNSHEDRLTQAGDSLKGDVSSLPVAIQSWMMGASAQLALFQLWEAWKRASEAGEVVLVLTGDEISKLVPEKLRS